MPGQFLYGFCLALIFLAAFSLRTKGLSKYDLWYDEINTERYSHDTPVFVLEKFLQDTPEAGETRNEASSAARFFTRLKRDYYHAPLYYVLVWLWSCVFHGAMALRWMSVVMGLAALGIFYLISRQILRSWEALGALAIMAASPFHIWYSQEARAYAAISLFSLVAVYCLRGAVKTNRWRWWFAFLFSGIAAVLTSYYSILLLAVAGFVALKRNDHSLFRGGLCLALIAAVCFVLLPGLMVQSARAYHGAVFWLNPPTLRILLFSPLVFTAGYLTSPWQMAFGFMMCWSLLARGMYVFFHEDKEKFIFLFACSCLPVFLIFLVSRCGMPIYLDRQLILFAPFFYLFIARGIGSIKEKVFKLGAVSLMGIFLIMALVNYYQGTIYCSEEQKENFYPGVHARKNYGEPMRRVFNEFRLGDKIITADRQTTAIVCWVLRANLAISKQDPHVFVFSPETLLRGDKVSSVWIAENVNAAVCGESDLCGCFYHFKGPLEVRKMVRKIEERDFEMQRVWFISSSWDKNAFVPENVVFVEKILTDKFKKTMSFDKDGFFVVLYEKKNAAGR